VVELSHDSRPIIGRGPPLTAWFLVLAAMSVGLMVADQRYRQIDQIRGWLGSAVYPVQRAVDLPFRATDWVTQSFADRSKLREENLKLQTRLRLANLQLQRFAALEEENRRLRDMREDTTGIADRVLVAEILNVDLDPFRHRVLLDKGQADGVFRGQAVLDGEGIFGQVTKVNERTAEAILISDTEHAIPVQSNRSGMRTIAVGSGEQNRLVLPFVTVESDLQEGDLLLSSGMGGIFPAGYPVAKVTRVQRSGGTFAAVEARPTAQLDRAREVLLVWFTERPMDAFSPPNAPPPTAAEMEAMGAVPPPLPRPSPQPSPAAAGEGATPSPRPSPAAAGEGATPSPQPSPAAAGEGATPSPQPSPAAAGEGATPSPQPSPAGAGEGAAGEGAGAGE
jgi:rod shape-determining protein MreC